MTGTAATAASITDRVLARVGNAGGACLLWTVIMCVALFKQDGETLRLLWRQLVCTWYTLAAAWVLGTWIIAAWRSRRAASPGAVSRPPAEHAECDRGA